MDSVRCDRWQEKDYHLLLPARDSRVLVDIPNQPRLHSGSLWVECTTAKHNSTFLKLKTLLINLLVTPHKPLNTSKSVIHFRGLQHSNEAEIRFGLKNQGVTLAHGRHGDDSVPTNTHILTFSTFKIILSITVGYKRLTVRRIFLIHSVVYVDKRLAPTKGRWS